MHPPNKETLFFNSVRELFDLYEKVKLTIIYSENFDPEQELYVAPINQLRSALDHIFKAVNHADDMEYELKEAKEHLERAGYDAFEIFASNLGIQIINKLKPYTTTDITNTFPEYYKEIKPKLTEIRANLGQIRKHKKENNGKIDSFEAYSDQINTLIEFDKKVNYAIPAIEEYKLKRKKEKHKDIFKNIIIAIVSGLIVYFITKSMHK